MLDVVILLIFDGDGWGHMGGGWGWGMAIMGMLMMISIVALVIWAIVSFSRRPVESSSSSNRALGLLDERYAAGDLDRDEYLQRRDDLER